MPRRIVDRCSWSFAPGIGLCLDWGAVMPHGAPDQVQLAGEIAACLAYHEVHPHADPLYQ
jgi:hypothetical protein